MLPKQYFKFRALFFFQAVIYLKMEATQNELTGGRDHRRYFRELQDSGGTVSTQDPRHLRLQ